MPQRTMHQHLGAPSNHQPNRVGFDRLQTRVPESGIQRGCDIQYRIGQRAIEVEQDRLEFAASGHADLSFGGRMEVSKVIHIDVAAE